MFKNIGTTWILNLFQMVVLMWLAPFVVGHLGLNQNGVWVTIVSFTGVLRLLILGVPMASVRYIAEHIVNRDLQRTNAAVSTCLGICVGLGLLSLLVGAVLFFAFDANYLHGTGGRDLAPDLIEGARIAFVIVVVQVAAGFAMRLPYGIFDAHHDFVLRNMVMAGELILRLTLTLILLSWHATLPVLASIQVLCILGEFAALSLIIRRRYAGVRLSLAAFDRTVVPEILRFSLFAMVLNVGTLLAFQMDALVIGKFLDPVQVTFFDMGNKFFDPLTSLLIAVAAVVMPTATKLSATGDLSELRHVFLKWSKISLSIVLLIGTYLCVLGPEFLGRWVGPEFVGPSGRVLQVLMLSFLFYLPVRGVALPVLMGLGKPAYPALALLGMGLINLGLSVALVREHGILGVALGTAIPNVLFAAAVLVLACRELGVSLASYLGYVAGKATVGALAPLAFLLWIKSAFVIESYVALIANGVAMVAIFALTWIFFVYRNDPYVDLRGALARIAAAGSRRSAS